MESTRGVASVSPFVSGVHPGLCHGIRLSDGLLGRLSRFSPVFEGAVVARRRHLERVREVFDTLRGAEALLTTSKLPTALEMYDMPRAPVAGAISSVCGDGEIEAGVDFETCLAAVDVALTADRCVAVVANVKARVGGDSRMKSGRAARVGSLPRWTTRSLVIVGCRGSGI